jgi:hypothetical protein
VPGADRPRGHPLILGDLKPDYVDLVRAVGGQVIRIGRGIGGLNPLDPGGLRSAVAALSGTAADQLTAQLHGRQVVITSGLIELVRRARLADHEQAAVAAAIAVLNRSHTGVPILPDLVAVLQDAPPQVRTAIWDRGDDDEYARLVDPLLRSLTALMPPGHGLDLWAIAQVAEPREQDETATTPTASMTTAAIRPIPPANRAAEGRACP